MTNQSDDNVQWELVRDEETDNWFYFLEGEEKRAQLRLLNDVWFIAIYRGTERDISAVRNFWDGLKFVKEQTAVNLVAKEELYKQLYTVWGHRKKSVLKEI